MTSVTETIVTKNNVMRTILSSLRIMAKTRQPILITGETGVGKELIAKAIHRDSGLSGEMVIINAAGLDDHMFSDTLFGHVKGAFTGADRNRKGLIEHAANGTLFLDEIGDLSSISQVKLLRLLQDKEYFPLGSDTLKRSRARVVTATNRDLWQLQKSGHFRIDLNFRLRAHHVHVPPLRERKEDIPLLVKHFEKLAAKELNVPVPELPGNVLKLLAGYDFPGNIRELQQMVYNAVNLNGSHQPINQYFQDHIHKSNPCDCMENGLADAPETKTLEFSKKLPTLKEATRLLISEAIKRTNGNITEASRLLGISRQALSKRLSSGDVLVDQEK